MQRAGYPSYTTGLNFSASLLLSHISVMVSEPLIPLFQTCPIPLLKSLVTPLNPSPDTSPRFSPLGIPGYAAVKH